MSKEYKELKVVTAAAIYDAGDKQSLCFRQKFQSFLGWTHEYYVEDLGQSRFLFFEEISIQALQTQFEEHPEWEKFLLEKGFIEEVAPPQKFYSVTNIFQSTLTPHNRFMLALVGRNEVEFVSLDSQVYSNTPRVTVKDPHRITDEEFFRLTRNNTNLYYYKVEEVI